MLQAVEGRSRGNVYTNGHTRPLEAPRPALLLPAKLPELPVPPSAPLRARSPAHEHVSKHCVGQESRCRNTYDVLAAKSRSSHASKSPVPYHHTLLPGPASLTEALCWKSCNDFSRLPSFAAWISEAAAFCFVLGSSAVCGGGAPFPFA